MNVTLACTQMACSWNLSENLERAERLVAQAADQGEQIVLLQELFATPYFCIDSQDKHFELAQALQDNPLINRLRALALSERQIGSALLVASLAGIPGAFAIVLLGSRMSMTD